MFCLLDVLSVDVLSVSQILSVGEMGQTLHLIVGEMGVGQMGAGKMGVGKTLISWLCLYLLQNFGYSNFTRILLKQ